MSHRSTRDLLLLHAVRILGFAETGVIAERAGIDHERAQRTLRDWERQGWVSHSEFAGLGGWSLTAAGRAENERQLAEELLDADPTGEVAGFYREFLPLNARLLRAVTDWQLRPTATDRLAPNDHSDAEWDDRVLDELAALARELEPLLDRLVAVLPRFDGYLDRYRTALRHAWRGRSEWVDRTQDPTVDSCHRVWFQLHEDLMATLGLDRRNEA